MKISRRRVLAPIFALPFLARAADKPAPGEKQEATPFVGSWFVTSATTSLVVSIEPHGEALFLFIEGGAFSIARTTWKEAPGGVLMDGLPRIRLWPGTDPHNVRAEIEPLPDDLEVSDGFRQFPKKFFMRRAATGRVLGDFGRRPLPVGWEKPTVDKEWDEQAGKRQRSGRGTLSPPGRRGVEE